MARFLIISFLVVLVMLITSVVSDNPIYQWSFCSNTSGNYTPLGTYQVNINRVLFGQIRYNILNTGFSTGESTAQDDNKVYGVGLCRGDLTPESCETCIYNASADVIPRCSSTKEAFIWYDECFVRYSNRSFFGILDISPSGFIANPRNVLGDANQFNELVTETMGNLRTQAAFNTSNLFATGEVGFTGSNSNSNVYGLVQCIRDLSNNDCSRCLQSAIDSLPSCCTGKEGASVFLPSCYLRYETFKFYDDVRTIGGPAASPLPPPSGNRLGKGTGNKSRKRIVISTSLAAILATALFCLFLYCRWGRKQRGKRTRQAYEDDQKFGANEMETKIMVDYQYDDISAEDQMNPQELPLVPLSVIKVATNNFADANKLGQGGFGQVYKATLNEKEIAVKRLLTTSTQGLEEFKNEVILIAKLQHRNLVRLLGCCIEEEEKLLIYEYMPNTSLDMFLFGLTVSSSSSCLLEKVKRGNLSWKQRFNIINGIARGLLYLHEDSRLRIIHRDLKASNVLLDNEMNPKISDFGMARIFGGNQSEANTNRVVGTYGYMAPEYAMQGLFSVKSDVYSFGVLLLEIISGKRNNNEFYQSEHAQSLLAYAWRLWCDGRGLEFIDSLMGVSCDLNEVLKCMHIGLLCVQEDAADRPTMSTVVVMFASYTITLPGPTQPAFSVGRLVTESSKFSETSTSGSTNEITVSEVLAR